MADTTDLLHISDTLDEINGESIDNTPDYGMNYTYLYIGMSGQKMVDKMNENFHATDAEFLAMAAAIGLRIISQQIKELKVEDNVVYYTTDGETWKSLQASWGNIAGNLSDQADLSEALADKIGTETFNLLVGRVDSNEINIGILDDLLNSTNLRLDGVYNQINSAGGILVRLGAAENTLANKISSPSVISIRTESSGTALEFTTDGEHWYPVSSAGIINWGQIDGNIDEQNDLRLKFQRVSQDINAVSDILTLHAGDTSNPHQVTKSQVGLGNVDNTSDMNKPLSTAQKQYVDDNIKFVSLTQAQYEALSTKNNTTLYFINDL